MSLNKVTRGSNSRKGGRSRHHRLNPVDVVNTEITKLASAVAALQLPAFGPACHNLEDESLNSAVVGHRLVGKFLNPERVDENLMHQRDVLKMVHHDERGFVFEPRETPSAARAIIYNARNRLSEWLAGLKPSYHFRPPSGESALSNEGFTDVVYKLDDLTHWEVSESALPYATAICYNNLWLKRLVKHHFSAKFGDRAAFIKQYWYRTYRRVPRKVSIGFYVFGKMFRALCQINTVVRITSIFKDARSRRVISMVPLWDMVCQLSWMMDVRQHTNQKLGFDVYTRADLHKTLIAHRRFATIDLRNASNSIWHSVVRFMFPAHVIRTFDAIVSRHYEYDVGNGVEYGYFNMFSPMGVGVTFDVMTLLLLAVGRELSSTATVFGDDIMIDAAYATHMIEVLECLGLETNVEKTFVAGNLSESCGGFYNHSSEEYITCYDFLWCENITDALVTVNKLRALLRAHQVNRALYALIFKSYFRLHRILRRYAAVGDGLPSGFMQVGNSWLIPRRKDTMAVKCMRLAWQRKITVAPIKVHRSLEVPITESVATWASWFYRGRTYVPGPRETRITTEICDTFSQAPLRDCLLVSVLTK